MLNCVDGVAGVAGVAGVDTGAGCAWGMGAGTCAFSSVGVRGLVMTGAGGIAGIAGSTAAVAVVADLVCKEALKLVGMDWLRSLAVLTRTLVALPKGLGLGLWGVS